MAEKEKNKDNQPPSLFDDLSLFAGMNAVDAEKDTDAAAPARAAPPPPAPDRKSGV